VHDRAGVPAAAGAHLRPRPPLRRAVAGPVDELVALLASPTRDAGAVDDAVRELDRRVALLHDAATPALVARRIAGFAGRSTHDASAARVAGVRARASAARARAAA